MNIVGLFAHYDIIESQRRKNPSESERAAQSKPELLARVTYLIFETLAITAVHMWQKMEKEAYEVLLENVRETRTECKSIIIFRRIRKFIIRGDKLLMRRQKEAHRAPEGIFSSQIYLFPPNTASS